MIKAIKDGNVIEVTKGAFDGIFSRQGYVVIKDKNAKKECLISEEKQLSEDEKFVVAMKEKPLSQMTKAEVKRFASIVGVDLTGVKNTTEAKERIKPKLGL